MATHLRDVRKNGHCYFISYAGENVYYSKDSRGKGTTTINGIKYKSSKEQFVYPNGSAIKDDELDDIIIKLINP